MADLAQLLAQAQAQREAQNPLLAGAQSVQESMSRAFTPQNLKGVGGGDVALAAIAGALASGSMGYFGRKQEDDTKAAENAALAQALQSNDPAATAVTLDALRQHPSVLLGLQDRSTEIANKNDEQARLWRNLGYKKGPNGTWDIDPDSPVIQKIAQDQEQIAEQKRYHDQSFSINQQKIAQDQEQIAEQKRYHDQSFSMNQQELGLRQQELSNMDKYRQGMLANKEAALEAKTGGKLDEGLSVEDLNLNDHSDLNSIMADKNTARQLGVYEQKTPGVMQSNAKAWDVFTSGAKGKPSATKDAISLDSIIKNIDTLTKSDGNFRSDSGGKDLLYGATAFLGGSDTATARRAYDAIRLKVIEGDLSNLAPVTDVDLRSELNTALIGEDWGETKQKLAGIRARLQADSEVNKLVVKFAGANPTHLNNVSPAQIRAAARAMYDAKRQSFGGSAVGLPDDAAARALMGGR